MEKKVLILGNGFVASEFYTSYSPFSKSLRIDDSQNHISDLFCKRDMSSFKNKYFVSHFTGRITNAEQQISSILDTYKPDVVINCIGKTGNPNVDWCESHPDETIESNLSLPLALARLTNKRSVQLIHIGSGCINFGNSPSAQGNLYDPGWKESDVSNPKSFYSKIKYATDLALSNYDNVITFRIRMPISPIPNPRNLISKLLHYQAVIDIPNSMTFTEDLVKACSWAIDNKKTGIFNLASAQALSAYSIMSIYKKYNNNHKFSLMTESQLDRAVLAKRSNCILNCEKIKQNGFNFSNLNINNIIKEFYDIQLYLTTNMVKG